MPPEAGYPALQPRVTVSGPVCSFFFHSVLTLSYNRLPCSGRCQKGLARVFVRRAKLRFGYQPTCRTRVFFPSEQPVQGESSVSG